MKGSKPLMSEMLDDTRRYLEQAEKTDVSKLRDFLMNEPERPMIATGQGGSIPPAEYAALLYSSNCSIGKAMTPTLYPMQPCRMPNSSWSVRVGETLM